MQLVNRSMSVDLVSDRGNMDSFCLEERMSTGETRSLVTENGEGPRDISSSENEEKLAPDNSATARELCIYFLESSGLLPSSISSDIRASLDLHITDAKFLPCKACGIFSNPHKMMICDLCDEAFHLTCCGEKEPFSEDWFCQSCSKERPRPLLDTAIGNLLAQMDEESRKKMMARDLGPIFSMLNDFGDYTSKVRIGNDFQAVVPEWTGPANDIDDYFREPTTLDPTDCSSHDGWRFNRSLNSPSCGNWLQCKEVIYFDDDTKVVCGKWRRAPLFVTQTNNWDCSCSVVWDPFHADCAVPQEVETEEVLKQVKYIEQLKHQLNKKRKSENMNCANFRK